MQIMETIMEWNVVGMRHCFCFSFHSEMWVHPNRLFGNLAKFLTKTLHGTFYNMVIPLPLLHLLVEYFILFSLHHSYNKDENILKFQLPLRQGKK
jgi:hypothetical protein